MSRGSKTLAQVRARLDQLVDLRLSGPLSDGQLAEYEDLLTLEAALLEGSRSEPARDGDAPCV
jgi:hypothetical protein